MVLPGGHGRIYGMAWQAWHGTTWRGMGWYFLWPGVMKSIWYGLAHMAWYMVVPEGHGRIYGMAWRAWHGIWFCMVRFGKVYGVACRDEMYMVWPGQHSMV